MYGRESERKIKESDCVSFQVMNNSFNDDECFLDTSLSISEHETRAVTDLHEQTHVLKRAKSHDNTNRDEDDELASECFDL